jgi:hypothetical protein
VNDIAILKLSSDAPLGPTIQIACLPDPSKGKDYPNIYDQDVWAVGFGQYKSDSKSSSTLQNVKLVLYNGSSEVLCDLFGINDWSSQLCAGKDIIYAMIIYSFFKIA